MISTDFAPNEFWEDAVESLITLFLPWQYSEGKSHTRATHMLEELFPDTRATLFLSGRGTLSAVLEACNLPKGCEIIVQGFTCEAVVLPILKKKFVPVYADIEVETFSVDLNSLNKKITSKTKVIILQHSFGMVPKYRDRVLQLARKKKLVIIEDLAHGFEPEFWQRQKLSDKQVLLMSFGRSKALSSVFGGAALTSNRKIEAKLKSLEAALPYPSPVFIARLLCYKPIAFVSKKTYNFFGFGKFLHFLAKKSGLLIAEISQKEKDGQYDPYLDKKYPNALAKLLIVQLKKYAQLIEQRRGAVTQYRYNFPLYSSGTPTRFPLLIPDKYRTLNDVKKLGIYLGTWYSQPVAPAGLNLASVGYKTGSCPAAEKVCKMIVNLPTLVTYDEVQRVIRCLHLTK